MAEEISTCTWTQTDIARFPGEPQSWARPKPDRTAVLTAGSWHGLRHSAASRIAAGGATDQTLQALP
jgi:hypothetical protein